MTNWFYRLVRLSGRPVVLIDNGTFPSKVLDPQWSQQVWNHSPDGFEWGYAGSGPAQLALAIMLDYFQRDGEGAYPQELIERKAEEVYQLFKWQFITHLPTEGGQIASGDIQRWLHKN